MPVCTALLAVFIENRIFSTQEVLSLCWLTIGVMVAVWEGSATGSLTGVVLCSIATMCNAAMSSLTGKLMSEKIEALRLTFYMAPTSCLILFPLYLWREVSEPYGNDELQGKLQ